jgi:hypothetical protein
MEYSHAHQNGHIGLPQFGFLATPIKTVYSK